MQPQILGNGVPDHITLGDNQYIRVPAQQAYYPTKDQNALLSQI
jgi:hypothetical protein